MFLGLLQEIVMTQRHLPFVLFCTALLLPALASAASEEEMLHAFGDAARTLPSVPVQTPKPQPKPVAPKIIQKPAAQPELQTQLNHLRARVIELEKQKAALQLKNEQQEKRLQASSDKLTAELETAKKQPVVAAAPLTDPKSDAERDGYMLGQSIASNAVVQLQMVKDTGLTISLEQLIAGFSTQLQTGTSVMNSEEMSRRYAAMQEAINKNMGSLIEKGYARLNKQLDKRKSLLTQNGVHWFTVKSVNAKLIPEQQVQVSVKVSTLSGKVINDFADDKVPFDNTLPPLLYEGMSLTGTGGAVEGWALAKDIFEREPLPPWVAPYDVIHYQLAIK